MTHNPETVERVAKAIWPEIGGDATYDEAVKIRDGEMQDDDASPEQHAACLNYAHDLARAALSALPPQLKVWVGAMPESNGRQNYTAVVSRDGLDTHIEGFCFARSEYSGRVDYEADRMRWVLGLSEKEPYILDYDADIHSGYVAPELSSQEAHPSPKVRKLVWDGTFDHRKTAHCIIGTYEVCSDRHGVHCLFFEAGESVPHEVSPPCQNMDLAKAAAQADYEARILGALE